MTEVAPAAQAALSALEADPAGPVKLFLTGGMGTGKSTALATVRDILRGAGAAVLTRPPQPGDPPAAMVVDDAHLLTDAQLRTLADVAADPGTTVVVAAEPREQNPALRALTVTIEREHPRITLGAWSRAEVGHRLTIGDSSALDTLMTATAGLPFLVDAGGAAAPSADGMAQAAAAALTERLRRLDEPALSTLLIMSLSPGLGSSDVAAALGADAEAASTLVDRAYATGLLDSSHGAPFTSSLHHTIASLTGAARHHEIEAALLQSQVELSSMSTSLALALAEHGLRDQQLAGFLDQSATRTHRPGETARMLRAAMTAGAVGTALETRLADALALSGDCASAAALADSLLEVDDPGQRAAAVRIAASVATHDGNTGQAAELFGWLASGVGPDTDAMVGAAGAIVLVAAGEATAARALATDRSGPPTAAARTARSLAEGVLLTLEQPYAVAAARLGQAIGTDIRETEAMPDSAPALITLAAMHAGDTVRARSVIARAVGNGAGDVLFSQRHRLLQAWLRMQDGQLGSAATEVSAAIAGPDLHRRDALWAAALQTGIARRTGDSGALEKHWSAGMDVLAEYSIDLFSLLPLGELWVAAARLRRTDRLDYVLDQAFGLLRGLGDPPAWSLPLHWSGVHAAILATSPESMAPHGQALAVAADSSGFAATLAGAGRAWLRVLARQVDVDGVAAAARGLARFGLTWDATRLAGEAALQATDPRISGAMLQIARDLKLTTDAPDGFDAPVTGADGRVATSTTPGRSPLSEREREVAELLLLGMPYRDIGAQLFISAKTVEHHVARIRRRLGAESRSEMLSMLRAILIPQA